MPLGHVVVAVSSPADVFSGAETQAEWEEPEQATVV